MKSINKLFIACIMVLMTVGFCQTAFAAKTLSLSRNVSVINTGDDAARTATLDVVLSGGSDVNGLVFTLNYNPAVFTFEGLEKGSMDIDDGASYDPDNPPEAATIASTLYYQYNNKPDEGIVLIAAAAAQYFTADFTAFKAKFKVKPGIGNGNYEIGIQKTIIGPDTAANAGYDTPTFLAVAAGLDPDNDDPTTAETFEVAFEKGLITVGGGYDVTGTVVYASDPQSNADGALVKLIKVLDTGEFVLATQVVSDGSYTFTKVPKGTYRVKVTASTPGYQKLFVTNSFTVADVNITVDPNPIVLEAYAAKSGTVTINTGVLSGLRIEIRDGNTVIGTASVDASGNYVTPPLPTGNTYTIWAVYGNQEQELTSTSTFDWTLALGTVSGVIDDLCDDQVVEVFIRSEITQLKKSVMVTGASGGSDAFTLTDLLPGTDYVLSMVGDGVGPVYYDGAQTFAAATPITVIEGAVDGKDFVFDCGDLVTISGKVTVGGSDVAGATVKANNYDFNDYKFGSAVTDGSGDFEISVAKSDDYYVSFKYEGKSYYYKMGDSGAVAVTDRTLATQVDVIGADATGIDIPVVILVPDTAKLSGQVTLNRSLDDGGIPLENYLVGLYTTDNVPLHVTQTVSDGSYLFENMVPGTYNVGLLPPSPYARQVVEGVVLANGTTATADFIVDHNYEITGFVMDADVTTTPVVSARVDILKSNGGKLRSAAYTNASGQYTLVDIPSGVYTLIASHKDYFSNTPQEETVLADLTADTIELTKGAVVDGTVSDANGVVAGARVTLAGPGYVKSTKTSAAGFYQFRGLAASTPHIIKAAKGNQYAPFVAEDVDTGVAGSTVTHNMTLVIPVTAWTFSGTVKEADGTLVPNAYALLFSSATGYQKVVQTTSAGAFTFTHVTTGTDYALLVLPGDGKPEILEEGISIQADVAGHEVTLSAIAEITGTITLSEADAGAIVIAGAYDATSDLVHQVTAQDSGDNTTFTYTIKVATGVVYNVFAQDLKGTFPVKYYVSPGVSGVYADAGDVTNTTADVDIDLTK